MTPYLHDGAADWWTALVKGIVATWMVSLAAVMALVSRSVSGKIVVSPRHPPPGSLRGCGKQPSILA